MNRRNVILFAAGLAISLISASFQHAPGYMDSDYYMLGGRNLASGEGFTEWILWNYLDSPAGLPHPSHGYWMPLTSIIAAISLAFSPDAGFNQAQWGFVLVSALVPPLTATLAERLYSESGQKRRSRAAWLAGLLAVFPGYYFGFLTTTDSFGLYMVLGAAFFIVLIRDTGSPFRKTFLLGIITGLMHLTRADGFIWLFLAPAAAWQKDAKRAAGSAVGGYFIVMAAWLFRNQAVFGSPLAPGGSRAFWWVRYDDLFAFPPEILTFQRWWSAGLAAIVNARVTAAGQNLLSAIAVNGMVFLFPLMLAGIWQMRSKQVVRVGVAGWALPYLLMSFVFPFAGARGGFFHAAAAVQPFLWALVPEGLAAFVAWGQHLRNWKPAEAERIFGVGIIFIAVLATALLGWLRVISPGAGDPAVSAYREAAIFISRNGSPDEAIVMVNNPPGFALETGRPAIVIPDGGLPAILAAADRFGATILVLGPEQGLEDLYDDPEGQEGLVFMGSTSAGLKVFSIVGER